MWLNRGFVTITDLTVQSSGRTADRLNVSAAGPVCGRRVTAARLARFAAARRCSNEGRALMQLDYQQFVTKLERLTRLRPLPERQLVEAYIKAYYVPESALEDWIRQHKVSIEPEWPSGRLTVGPRIRACLSIQSAHIEPLSTTECWYIFVVITFS